MFAKMIVLRFPRDIVDKPIVTNLVRNYNLSFNILKATIFPRKEGLMVMELRGNRKDYQRGIEYLQRLGVDVDTISQDVRRDEEACYQCGACTAVCPTGALSVERPSMRVIFNSDKCSACELCVKACPTRAMIVSFNRNIEY